ncbi:MAG: AEC family transporter, partial [Bilophila wadsworthia]
MNKQYSSEAPMLSILSTLVPVFGIILFGIVVERMGFLPIETSGCLNQFVYWIGLPMMLFNQLARMEAGQMSGAMVGGILLGYGITYLFAYVVFSSLLRRRWEESSVFALLSSFPNAAFMGLPIVVLLLPDSSEAAIVASLCAVMTSANLLFTDGRLEAGKHKGEGRKQVFLSLLRSLFHNPLLIYSALGAAVSLLHIAVPKPILSMSAMLGSTSAPCALFCMGMILSKQ